MHLTLNVHKSYNHELVGPIRGETSQCCLHCDHKRAHISNSQKWTLSLSLPLLKKFTELNSRLCTNRTTSTFQKPLPLRCCTWSGPLTPSNLPLLPLLFFTFMRPTAFQAFKQHPCLNFIGVCVCPCVRVQTPDWLSTHPAPLPPTGSHHHPVSSSLRCRVMITALLGGHSGYLLEWDVWDCVRARVREVGER